LDPKTLKSIFGYGEPLAIKGYHLYNINYESITPPKIKELKKNHILYMWFVFNSLILGGVIDSREPNSHLTGVQLGQ
jgi:hypothetical protein